MLSLNQMAESESDTPIEQRYLWFDGKLSPKALKAIRAGLPGDIPPRSVILFVGFSYASLPIGKCFDVVFPKERPALGVKCRSRIHAVTQQMAEPFDHVPHGWKTICVVEFPDGVPSLIDSLPSIDAWYENRDRVCVCDEVTWEHLKAKGGHRI
jgi:hypothetical protein